MLCPVVLKPRSQIFFYFVIFSPGDHVMGQGEVTWGDATPRFLMLILLGIGGRGWVGALGARVASWRGFRGGF